MARRAPESEVLDVAKDLLTRQHYDADFDAKNSPAQDKNTFPPYAERRAENLRQRDLDAALREQGQQLLENYLSAPRARTPKFEFGARLQLARFFLKQGKKTAASAIVAPVAPKGDDFDEYRAAQKWIGKIRV